MKRERAVGLATQLLSTLYERRDEWPCDLVTEVYVFGSFARGAAEPHDLDILVLYNRTDPRWIAEFVGALSYGRSPYAVLRRALIGRARGVQLVFEDPGDLAPVLLWRRGDDLATALGRLHAVEEAQGAGRAPRDAMLPQLEGLDRWLPRPHRERLRGAVDSGAITLERLPCPTAWPSAAVSRGRISTDGRTRTARCAAPRRPYVLAHYETRGISPRHVHLHGEDVDQRHTPYFAGFNLRYFRAVPWCLTEHGGLEWIRATRTAPLHALRITPATPDLLADADSS